MASEIQFSFMAGKTTYFLVRNRNGQAWNVSTPAFETYATANYTSYAISCTQQGTASAYYAGSFPTTIPAGIYNVVGKEQLGGSAAETDPTIALGDYNWNGSNTFPLSDLATSGQIGQFAPIKIFRGQMVKPFTFKLVSAADHVTPLTSGVPSGQISRDGGSFGVLQSGAFSEMGLGWYSLQALTSGDLLANTVSLVFTANGISGGTSDARDFSLILQRTSGQ